MSRKSLRHSVTVRRAGAAQQELRAKTTCWWSPGWVGMSQAFRTADPWVSQDILQKAEQALVYSVYWL